MIYAFVNYLRQSVVRKLFIGYIVVILLPMLFIGFFINDFTGNIAKREFLSRIDSQLNQSIWSMDEIVNSCKNSTDHLRVSTSLLSVIIPQEMDDELMVENILFKIYPDIDAIKIYNRYIGSVRVLHGIGNMGNIGDLLLYNENIEKGLWQKSVPQFRNTGFSVKGDMLMGANHSIPVKDSQKKQTGFIEFYRPIYNTNASNNVIGILVFSIYDNILFNPLMNIKINKGEAILLFGEKGELLYASSKDFENIGQDQIKENSSENRIKINGRNYVAVKTQYQKLNGNLVYLVPNSTFNAADRNYRIYLIMVLLAGIMTMLFTAYIITSVVLKDIAWLMKAMKQVEGGNMDTEVSTRRIDEVGLLITTFNNMTIQIKTLMKNIKAASRAEKDAIYKHMESQIKPHFLCNVLDSVRMQAELDGRPKISSALSQITQYFGYNLSKSGSKVTLNEELKNLSTYIEIINMIRPVQINMDIHLDEELDGKLNDFMILKFSLQPIAENCIKHAFKYRVEKCFIFVYISLKDEKLHISIEDNGCGMEDEKLLELQKEIDSCLTPEHENLHSGIGLNNIVERIRYNYGDSYGIVIESSKGLGTCINLILPVIGKNS